MKRKICAEDHCRVVEGKEECHDKVVASAVEVPEETCSMAPEEECKNVTTSVPQVLPGISYTSCTELHSCFLSKSVA